MNRGWNADPNIASARVIVDGSDVVLQIPLNHHLFATKFKTGDQGFLRFSNCARYRVTCINDEGWFMGQCRFSKIAPDWGHFYEIRGDAMADMFVDRGDPDLNATFKWTKVAEVDGPRRHFLFYLKDDTFECEAEDWCFDDNPENALF